MLKTVFPTIIQGEIKVPASKSYMQRAIAISLLSNGKSTLLNPTYSNDSLAAIDVAQKLGAKIIKSDNSVEIIGGFNPVANILSVGESGLGMRMFSPIASLYENEITISGEGSILSRPTLVENALQQLGVTCETKNGFLPLKLKGGLKGGFAEIDGSMSSQFLTGLLIALPFAKNDSTLKVNNLKSKPYIDITLEILSEFGIEIINNNYEEFFIKGNQTAQAKEYFIEGDWSGASFWLVAGAISENINIQGLNSNSVQADKAMLDVIKMVGANVKIENNEIKISKNKLDAFEFDATDCPDLFPPLATLAANCNGISKIKGVHRLEHKESNRAETLQKEFSKVNINIEILNDEMIIKGGEIEGGTIHSNNDHRIAMAGAILALNAKDSITIENAESINKSYPNFFTDLERVIKI